VRAHVEEQARNAASRARVGAQLAAAWPGSSTGDDGTTVYLERFVLGRYRARVEVVDAGMTHVEVRDAPPELAVVLVSALAAYRRPRLAPYHPDELGDDERSRPVGAPGSS
jgi:hypothetical protein